MPVASEKYLNNCAVTASNGTKQKIVNFKIESLSYPKDDPYAKWTNPVEEGEGGRWGRERVESGGGI